MPLTRYATYSRREVHDFFDPFTAFTPQTGTWGLHGTVRIPERPRDWVFFVTFGQRQGHHQFDEGISSDGILTWQSQPHQTLRSREIQEWVQHDHLSDNIFLFLRTAARIPYWYLGRLAYVDHDLEQEEPVHFHWQILDWNPPAKTAAALRIHQQPQAQIYRVTNPGPIPSLGKRMRTAGVTSEKFRQGPRDYLAAAKENSELGLWGETWVLHYERNKWADQPRALAKIVHISANVGDGLGYDIRSISQNGSERFIEVKTTRGGPATPWFITPAELKFSAEHPNTYALYRLYNADPGNGTTDFFVLEGDLRAYVDLEPVAFQARLSTT